VSVAPKWLFPNGIVPRPKVATEGGPELHFGVMGHRAHFVFFCITFLAAEARAQAWSQVASEDGVTIWERSVPGKSLVEFRGQTIVEASMLRTLAVIRDDSHMHEWGDHSTYGFTLQRSGNVEVAYSHARSPSFLVSDRDLVFEATIQSLPQEHSIRVDLRATQHGGMPEQAGVVRITDLHGYWLLRELAPTRTEVTMEVNADPSGHIPHWVVNLTTRRFPLRTLTSLHEQVKKPSVDARLGAYEKILAAATP
jgi:hypothetical protein